MTIVPSHRRESGSSKKMGTKPEPWKKHFAPAEETAIIKPLDNYKSFYIQFEKSLGFYSWD